MQVHLGGMLSCATATFVTYCYHRERLYEETQQIIFRTFVQCYSYYISALISIMPQAHFGPVSPVEVTPLEVPGEDNNVSAQQQDQPSNDPQRQSSQSV